MSDLKKTVNVENDKVENAETTVEDIILETNQHLVGIIAEKEPNIALSDIEKGVEIITKQVLDIDDDIDYDELTDGVRYIVDGYFEYVKTVVTDRALPDERDGMKPVQRRIAYVLRDKKALTKSARIVGDTMGKFHPHGDASIYEAAVLMTDSNGSCAFPIIHGHGNLGGVDKTDPAAAMRYTELSRLSTMDEYFTDKYGMVLRPNFDNTDKEPEVLPVRFPALLVNSQSGIAVGFKANIPSFNFVDVCNLVKEYIKDGKCSTIIYPDFVTGGYVVKNEKEMLHIMKTGKGKFKLRGQLVVQDGKMLYATEVPYGKTIQGIIRQINDKDIKAIKSVMDSDDFAKVARFIVECKSKAAVEEATQALYRDTDFQYVFSSDITVVSNGEPKRKGVWDIIATWVEWRRQVIIKDITYRRNASMEQFKFSRAMMEVISHPDLKLEFGQVLFKEGKVAAAKYLLEHFDNQIINPDLAQAICEVPGSAYHNGGKYANDFKTATETLEHCDAILADVDAEISRQMDELIKKYGKTLKRRTQITDTDYIFDKSVANRTKIKDSTPCHYDFKDGFLRKLKNKADTPNLKFEFDGTCSDTLIAFDNIGRILRVYCNDIPLSGAADMGTYLPRYFGYDVAEGYKITYLGRLTGATLMLIYNDGNIGFVDENEWLTNTRSVKVLEKGIATTIANKLGAVINVSDLDVLDNYMLFVGDNKDRIGWVYLKDIARKNRTAKTRVFNMLKNGKITHYYITPENQGTLLLNNLDTYYGKMKRLNHSDFNGNPAIFSAMR